MSKTVPSGVQTGYSNGCRDKLEKREHNLVSKTNWKSQCNWQSHSASPVRDASIILAAVSSQVWKATP